MNSANSSESLTRIRPAVLGTSPFPTDKGQATDDEVFIVDGYWKSWRDSRWAGTTPRNWSLPVAIETVRQLVDRGAQVLVLESPEFDSLIGFVIYEVSPSGKEVVHYLYVKDLLRQRGFGTQLLDALGFAEGFAYTHKTRFTQYLKGVTHRGHRPELARQRTLK